MGYAAYQTDLGSLQRNPWCLINLTKERAMIHYEERLSIESLRIIEYVCGQSDSEEYPEHLTQSHKETEYGQADAAGHENTSSIN